MRTRSIAGLASLVLAGVLLGACAGAGESRPLEKTYNSEIAEKIGCGPDEVAVCIEVNCELEQFQCQARENVRELFKAGEFRH